MWRIIEHDCTKSRRVELVEPLVIRDGERRANRAGVGQLDAEFRGFCYRLFGHAERRENCRAP